MGTACTLGKIHQICIIPIRNTLTLGFRPHGACRLGHPCGMGSNPQATHALLGVSLCLEHCGKGPKSGFEYLLTRKTLQCVRMRQPHSLACVWYRKAPAPFRRF